MMSWFVIKDDKQKFNINLSMYIINTIPLKESALYSISALVVFLSEIPLVRFLIRQKLVRKYRTPPLTMKYSLFFRKRVVFNV